MQQFQTPEEEQTTLSPLPEQTTKSQEELRIATYMKESWAKRDYASCLTALESLIGVENAVVLKDIYLILVSATKKPFVRLWKNPHKRAIAEKAVNCLCASPSTEVFPYLVKILSAKEPTYAQMAEAALERHGNSITPALIKELNRASIPNACSANGAIRMLQLLQKYGDTRACNTLVQFAQKRSGYRSDKILKRAIALGFGVGILIMVPLGLLIGSEFPLDDSAPQPVSTKIVLFLTWWMFLTMALYAFFTICLFPFHALKNRKDQNSLAQCALQALQVIHDKKMAPHLVKLSWSGVGEANYEALKALRPLLSLVTPQDITLFASSEERLLANALEKHDEELTLSILHVLECVGTPVSLLHLSRLIRTNDNSVLVDSATRAYNAIEERMSWKEDKQTLLRASETPEHNNELLHPAQDDPEQEAQKRELLRPTEGEP